jgi:hypothetical protein
MELAPHQQRVVAEKEELDAKLAKLLAFFQTDVCLDLPMAERNRLMQQSVLMRGYSDVLGERIAAF